jgi:hypothetical protein
MIANHPRGKRRRWREASAAVGQTPKVERKNDGLHKRWKGWVLIQTPKCNNAK